MATINVRTKHTRLTHEGGPAKGITPYQELRRSVLACLLWEDTFYESGIDVAERIKQTARLVSGEQVSALAIEARTRHNIRHCPLLLAAMLMDARSPLVESTLSGIIQRPDELGEFLAVAGQVCERQKGNPRRIPRAAMRGMTAALRKFDAYQLAKWRGEGKSIKLRDVLRLIHAKPTDETQRKLWGAVVDGTIATPDTWEVELSASKDKKASWERLIRENRLGGLAILRNLSNMQKAGIDRELIQQAIAQGKYGRVLPFRFIAAARFAPEYEPQLEDAMFRRLAELPALPGHTIILVDHSGSMRSALSAKSDMERFDAACGVAMVCRELCESCEIWTFSDKHRYVPSRRGFALRDAIRNSMQWGTTNLGAALNTLLLKKAARIIVVTDEQAHDRVPDPPNGMRGYMLNVASYQNGVGYGPWMHVDGFSEAVISYITEFEKDFS